MAIIISRDADGLAERRNVEDALAGRFASTLGADALVVPHIYHIAENDDVWARLAAIPEPVIALAWIHPRATEWVLQHHAVGTGGLLTIDMGAYDSVAECIDACTARLTPGEKRGSVTELPAGAAQRWYPVIDGSRCVNCKQCMQFCLFGVYELNDSDQVTAAQPDNCKNGCPACSRICPNGAIIFPLYDKDAAIAGAPGEFVTPDDTARAMYERRTKQKHQASDSAPDDDLDALIDDLDRLTERNS
jgi:NAD-dependent dihydropyrimidine dehydrogenase PreA subunit